MNEGVAVPGNFAVKAVSASNKIRRAVPTFTASFGLLPGVTPSTTENIPSAAILTDTIFDLLQSAALTIGAPEGFGFLLALLDGFLVALILGFAVTLIDGLGVDIVVLLTVDVGFGVLLEAAETLVDAKVTERSRTRKCFIFLIVHDCTIRATFRGCLVLIHLSSTIPVLFI